MKGNGDTKSVLQRQEQGKSPETLRKTEINGFLDKVFKMTFLKALIMVRRMMDEQRESFNKEKDNVRKKEHKVRS